MTCPAGPCEPELTYTEYSQALQGRLHTPTTLARALSSEVCRQHGGSRKAAATVTCSTPSGQQQTVPQGCPSVVYLWKKDLSAHITSRTYSLDQPSQGQHWLISLCKAQTWVIERTAEAKPEALVKNVSRFLHLSSDYTASLHQSSSSMLSSEAFTGTAQLGLSNQALKTISLFSIRTIVREKTNSFNSKINP